MSLILKGIDLPHEEINLTITKDGRIYLDNKYHLIAKAIQIPKDHGRLIDEREVKKAQFIINDQWGSYPVISLGNLNRVPMILEEEKEDERK